MAASMTTSAPTAVRRESRLRENIRLVLSYALLFLIALVFLYPFVLAISTSFKTLPEINERPVALIPQTFTLEGYQRMFALNVGRWAFNSFFIAATVTISNVLKASLLSKWAKPRLIR
jgi:multiple sugar transport system permease protein